MNNRVLGMGIAGVLVLIIVITVIVQLVSPTPGATPYLVLRVVDSLIRWLLVPGILLGLLGLAIHIMRLPSKSEDAGEMRADRVSKLMALFLGLSAFVLVLVLSLSTGMPMQSHGAGNAASFTWWYLPIGFVLGVATMTAVDQFLEAKGISSMLVAILSGTSLVVLYFYLINSWRTEILISTMGFVIGALVYTVFFPTLITKL